MRNHLIKMTSIYILLLVCVGMSGCATTRLEHSGDADEAPLSQDKVSSTTGAPISAAAPAFEDGADDGGADGSLASTPEVSEIKPVSEATLNAENATGKSAEKKCAPDYDFPVVINAQVEELLDYYTTGRGRRSFQLWLERSGRYLPLMQQTFAAEGLPQDLAMLALIESGFNSNAHSWANAVGYWQFIESTGRMYGLENTWWRDERRDVEKATRAAAEYLSDLHARFDDWYLAVAAYNAGPGKMLNAIRRHNSRDFWRLAQGNYLRAETKRYIPKLLAAIILAKEPVRYGFNEIEYAQPLKFDTVVVSEPTDLEVVVEITGVDYSILKRLNPELKRWCTPPGVQNYSLRVPPGAAQGFAERYAQIPAEKRNRYRRHELKPGENLALLARRYNIRVDDIIILNKIGDPRRLQIGQNLILPLHHEYTSTPVAELEDDYMRTYRRSYTVRKGDSLWSIARSNDVSEKQLRVWNRLGWSDLIQPGQKLLVSAPPSRSNKSYTPARQIVYKVRKGDTLWDIGRQYSVETGDIRQWNNLAENHILRPGDELTLKLASSRS
jgi:membrane-bound lytic murein transglycosylase D